MGIKKAIGVAALLFAGILIGMITLQLIKNREEQFDRNVELAYENAARQIHTSHPLQNGLVTNNSKFPALEEECFKGASVILHYAAGSSQQLPIKQFDLTGFVSAFDGHQIGVYRTVSATDTPYLFGCMFDSDLDFVHSKFFPRPGQRQ